MARPRKNGNIPSNVKDAKKETFKEQKTEVSAKTEEVNQSEEKILHSLVIPKSMMDSNSKVEETVSDSETKKEEKIVGSAEVSETKAEETIIDIPVIGAPDEFVEDPNPNKDNFKKVEVISDEEKKFHMNVSEVILRLKKQPQYKFLSKVSLTKIATNIVNKKFYSE